MSTSSWRIEVHHGNLELSFADTMVTIGGRNGADVVLRDVMVADRHCIISYEDGFVLRDAGSVVGTWVRGERAAPTVTLEDGDEVVIGSTRIAAAVQEEDGVAVLTLRADPQSFWWKRPGKGAFGNDPDRLALSEARFGRFPTLKFSNRVAAIAGATVLLGATFVTSVMEPLADPGPLMPPHALVTTASLDDPRIHAGLTRCVELSGEQGCNVCHTTGSGAPERKCAQCHGLEGDMGHPGSWRHPYHVDGDVSDQQHCVLCHTDHNGGTDRKPISDQLVGDCEACHGAEAEALKSKVQLPRLEQPETAFQDLRFPHSKHLAKEIECGVCHQIADDVKATFDQGLPDDPARHDYAEVAYKVCASCHVDGAEAVNMTAAQQVAWREEAANQQWRVDWHGTEAEDGARCLQCHAQTQRAGADVIGPEMKTTPRGTWNAAQYRRERALYVNQTRSHEEQFAAHADGKKCTECHLDNQVAAAGPTERPARPFWHGLHMASGALSPPDDGAAARWSADPAQGCVSCHSDLGSPDADHLTPFDPARPDSSYHWPQSPAEQAACKECHREGQDLLPLAAVAPTATAAEATQRPDFPHDVHVMSAAFGADGTLAKGCFACHEFSSADGEGPFTQVPRTLPGAMDCTSCHAGHDDIGGGDCQQCHPKLEGRGNSFLWQAKVGPESTRPWPARNSFQHLSPGHVREDCSACHDAARLVQAGALGDLRVPDESERLCRDCHFAKQYHWR
jgi:hypothetical protein